MRQSTRIAEGLSDKSLKFLIARDQETKKTASFCQWSMPKEDGEDLRDAKMTSAELVNLVDYIIIIYPSVALTTGDAGGGEDSV